MQTPAPFSILETLQDQLQREQELDMQRLLARAPEFSAIHETLSGLSGHGATNIEIISATLLVGYSQGRSDDIMICAVSAPEQRDIIVAAAKSSGFDVWAGSYKTAADAHGTLCIHPTGWLLHITASDAGEETIPQAA